MPLDYHPTASPPDTPAAWHAHAWRAWRDLADARAENRALRELLQLAIEMLREQDIELDRLRRRVRELAEERRAEPRRGAA